jgi:hypothetical protein
MHRRDWPQHRGPERGSIFVLALVILVVVFMLGASLIERSQVAVSRASAAGRTAKSFQLAEGGISKALWELNQPNGWLTYAGESSLDLAGGTVDIGVAPLPAGRGVFTDTLNIIATARLPGPEGGTRDPCTIRMIAHKDPRYFSYAVFGDQHVTIGNGTISVKTDSYTSTDGAYGGSNLGQEADIGTNSSQANAVQVLPQGEVHGNVTVGVGATAPDLCVDNKGTITGQISGLQVPNLLPPIVGYPSGTVELGDVWLESSQQLVLNAGSYHMTDLDMFGDSSIVCNGQVTIYIDMTGDAPTPDVRIGGNGIVNTSKIPANLTIYCAQDVTNIAISGNAALYAGIYAPQANIVINSGQLYGSVVGRSVTLNGATANVHYDKALRDNTNPRAVMRSWEVL